jgi:hypothetical protein
MWDAASGQPTYMFGAIDAPGGAATMGNFANDGVAMVGHLA